MDINTIRAVAAQYGMNGTLFATQLGGSFLNSFTQGYIYSTGTNKAATPELIVNKSGSGNSLVDGTYGAKPNTQLAIGIGIDCSNLVYQGLLSAGYNVKYLSTAQIGTSEDKNFVKVGSSQPCLSVLQAL